MKLECWWYGTMAIKLHLQNITPLGVEVDTCTYLYCGGQLTTSYDFIDRLGR